MIKKNTKVIFEGDNNDELSSIGGIPLSEGEVIEINRANKVTEYKVISKKVNISFEGDDQIVDITYTLKEL